MTDEIQRAVQSLAYANGLTRAIAVFCAQDLVFVLVVAWLPVVYHHRARLTPATVTRLLALLAASYLAAKLISHVVNDPRPYLVQHIEPLLPLARDNGFPSDHALLAWALAVSLVWLVPGAVGPFVVGAVVVMLARLGVAAHHTLDVAGSAAIVLVVALALTRLPLPEAWNRSLFADPRLPPVLRIP